MFEICQADLKKDEDQAYRKIKLCCEEVQGHYCLTQFHGLSFTTDKLCSMVRKWQTLVEASVDVKATDSCVMRMFCIGFTKKRLNQLKKRATPTHRSAKPSAKRCATSWPRRPTPATSKSLSTNCAPRPHAPAAVDPSST